MFYNVSCKLKPTFSYMSCLTLQPRFCHRCVLRVVCDSPFDSSVNSTHRLMRLPRSGSVALSSRATVTWLVRVDRQIRGEILKFNVSDGAKRKGLDA